MKAQIRQEYEGKITHKRGLLMRNSKVSNLVITAFFILAMVAGAAAGAAVHGLYLRVHARTVPAASMEGDIKIVPMGHAIGVRINTEGILVLGTGAFACEDGIQHRPSDNILRSGDLILAADGQVLEDKEALATFVAESTGDIIFTVNRDDREMELTVTPVTAAADDTRRIGAWVRDSTKGIGTLTFACPATGRFGALGHGIMDVDTRNLISVRSGQIMPSRVVGATRGARGAPGELSGEVDTDDFLGYIHANEQGGIYGTLSDEMQELAELLTPMPIARREMIAPGPATILTTVAGTAPKEYEITIENVNRSPNCPTKAMVIRITDPALLALTGGIVQGMSGSPILQNGRVVGAVTHVFVQDPTKGYAILMEYMLRGM
jgi:stage IV sporulation protein B